MLELLLLNLTGYFMITFHRIDILFMILGTLFCVGSLVSLFIVHFSFSKKRSIILEQEKRKIQDDFTDIKEQYGYLNGKIEGITKLHSDILFKIEESIKNNK